MSDYNSYMSFFFIPYAFYVSPIPWNVDALVRAPGHFDFRKLSFP